MATIEHNGTSYEVDGKGFLVNGSVDWDEKWVEYVGSKSSIKLTNEQLNFIKEVQECFLDSDVLPRPCFFPNFFTDFDEVMLVVKMAGLKHPGIGSCE